MSQVGTPIDVEQVVADLQERVAKARAKGGHDQAILDTRFSLGQDRIVLRPEVAFSSKRVIGPPISALKRTLIRLQFRFLDDVVGQVNAAIDAERLARESEVGLREVLAVRVQSLEAELEGTRAQLREMQQRLETVESRADLVADWDALDLLGRLALVERANRNRDNLELGGCRFLSIIWHPLRRQSLGLGEQ